MTKIELLEAAKVTLNRWPVAYTDNGLCFAVSKAGSSNNGSAIMVAEIRQEIMTLM